MKFALAAFLAAAAAGAAVPVAAQSSARPARVPTADEVDAFMRTNSEVGPYYRALKELYPREYDQFIATVVEAAKRGETGDRAFAEGFAWARRFYASKYRHMFSARAELLASLARANHALALHLQKENPAYCAQYATTGLSAQTRLPPAAMLLLGEVNVVQLRAAKSGELKEGPKRSGLTPSDAQAWFEAMERLHPQEARLVKSGREGSGEAEKCAVGVASYHSITALPVDQAARVMAYFIEIAAESQLSQ